MTELERATALIDVEDQTDDAQSVRPQSFLRRDIRVVCRSAASVTAAAVILAMLVGTGDVEGQTLRGRVVEDGRDSPVAGANVSLLNRDGDHRAGASADSLGRFLLTPPEAGEYYIESVRIGYETTRSPLLALTAVDTVPFEITMVALPLGLEGFEVTVEAEAVQFLRSFGHTPASLRNRWIDADAIEAMPLPVGVREVIRWRGIAGLTVREDNSGAVPTLCVMFQRGRTATGLNQCALILLNGVRIHPEIAQSINPADLEGIAVLTPVDASTFYGTNAGGGAVLMWTRGR
jgi:hypothetical protein